MVPTGQHDVAAFDKGANLFRHDRAVIHADETRLPLVQHRLVHEHGGEGQADLSMRACISALRPLRATMPGRATAVFALSSADRMAETAARALRCRSSERGRALVSRVPAGWRSRPGRPCRPGGDGTAPRRSAARSRRRRSCGGMMAEAHTTGWSRVKQVVLAIAEGDGWRRGWSARLRGAPTRWKIGRCSA